MSTWIHRFAEKQDIPLRTLDDVKAGLAGAKTRRADKAMAGLMLRHGRLTDEAREYVASYMTKPARN